MISPTKFYQPTHSYLLMTLNYPSASTLALVNKTYKKTLIASISSWCDTWSLTLNKVKCNCLRISLSYRHRHALDSTSPVTPQYFCSGLSYNYIHFTSKQHDLGMIITDDLSWSLHYDHITAKAYRALSLI